MPEPYSFLYFATRGESQGVGAGPAGFGGAGCPAAAAAGAGGLVGAGAAGFAGGAAGAAAFGGVVTSEGGEGLVGVVVAVSDSTEPEGVDFTPPGVAGLSAVGFSFSGGGGVGILVSSGIERRHRLRRRLRFERTITFISLRGWCQRAGACLFSKIRRTVTKSFPFRK